VAGLTAAMAIAALAVRAALHPLHTTLTTMTYDAASHQVTAVVRTFASDFSTAVARRSGRAAPDDDRVSDSASFAYLATALSVADRDGHALSLVWCGSRRTGDLLWLCVRGATPTGMRGLRLDNRALMELYADQVNIVMADYDGRSESMLFTKGSGAERLP
jgi:hypothetical protein